MNKLTYNEKRFLSELRDLLKCYELTIEQRTSYDSAYHWEDWAFEGRNFELDLCDVADWLDDY